MEGGRWISDEEDGVEGEGIAATWEEDEEGTPYVKSSGENSS